MPSGIHILSEITRMSDTKVDLYFSTIVAFIGLSSLAISVKLYYQKSKLRTATIIACIVCLLLSAFSLNSYNHRKPITTYKVTIDNSVSFNEFDQEYRVLGKEGKIYTIREK
jgi:hypothetical protein